MVNLVHHTQTNHFISGLFEKVGTLNTYACWIHFPSNSTMQYEPTFPIPALGSICALFCYSIQPAPNLFSITSGNVSRIIQHTVWNRLSLSSRSSITVFDLVASIASPFSRRFWRRDSFRRSTIERATVGSFTFTSTICYRSIIGKVINTNHNGTND